MSRSFKAAASVSVLAAMAAFLLGMIGFLALTLAGDYSGTRSLLSVLFLGGLVAVYAIAGLVALSEPKPAAASASPAAPPPHRAMLPRSPRALPRP
jgi:hypothetical protein